MPNDQRHTVEGYWDCRYCGREGIRGRFKNCPGCGHGRDASVRFYTKEIDEDHAISREEFERQTDEAAKYSRSESANYTTAETVDASTPSLYDRKEGEGRGDEHDATDTSDWYCDYCDSYNPAAAKFCTSCGAAREQSSGKTYQQTMGTVARTYDSKGNLVSERDLSGKTSKPKPEVQPSQSGGGGCLKFIIIGAAVALIIGLIVSFIGNRPREITVEGFDWERTIAVEQYQTVDDSGWSLPDGARLDHSEREIREYQQVLDHYETVEYQVPEKVIDHYETYTTEVDNGDGTFDVETHQEPVYTTQYRTETKQEPVYASVPIYDTKYYYKIEKWVHARDVVTSGEDHDPKWGKVELASGTGANDIGKEREGERSGEYGVIDTSGNRYTADEDYWNTLEVGQKLKVKIDGNRHISPK